MIVNGGFSDVKYSDISSWPVLIQVWCLFFFHFFPPKTPRKDVPYVCHTPMLVGYTLDISQMFISYIRSFNACSEPNL